MGGWMIRFVSSIYQKKQDKSYHMNERVILENTNWSFILELEIMQDVSKTYCLTAHAPIQVLVDYKLCNIENVFMLKQT